MTRCICPLTHYNEDCPIHGESVMGKVDIRAKIVKPVRATPKLDACITEMYELAESQLLRPNDNLLLQALKEIRDILRERK